MSAAPDDMATDQRSGEPDDLRSIDQALLVAIARIPRSSSPLSDAEVRLLDDWIHGRLSAGDAEQAAELTRQNSFAAERIMERRLVAAADTGPGVPPVLTSRILKAAQPARFAPPKVLRFRWPVLSSLQWSAAGAAIAATLAAGIFVVLTEHQNTQSYQRVQLAMVTIDDRRALSGAPQYRTLRSDGTAPAADGFRDVDIPADLLRRAIAGAESSNRGALASQLRVYLPPRNGTDELPRIVIDSVLADRLSGEWSGRTILPIRAYNLEDPRMKVVRENLSAQLGTGPDVLLSVRR